MSYFEGGPKYRDREDAGKVLVSRLKKWKEENPLVLAIPNGGVPVGYVIAEELSIDLYLMIVRKLQVPGSPEAGFGAIASDGCLLLNHDLMDSIGLSEKEIEVQKEKALKSIKKRQELFGKRADLPALDGRTVLLVDDGLASGFTMSAAVESVKNQNAKKIVVAVPTSSSSAYERLRSKADEIICPDVSGLHIFAVANAYEYWYDVTEEEVIKLLLRLPFPD